MSDRLGLDDFNTIPRQENGDKPRHSWTPSSLIDLAQNPPEPPTIGGMLYPGKRTLISGETESLKTWLALILAKAEMALELPVAWVDLDDMGAGAILDRLRALHVPDSVIGDFFLYYTPDEQLKGDRLADVLMGLTVTGTRLMIIDAFTPMLHLHGLDPNNSMDIEAFWKQIADPIAKTGTAPCVLDHVVKNADGRGKYATGSERKASGATVHLGTSPLTPLAIGGSGRSLIQVHKDRLGYLPRPTLGVMALESDGEFVDFRLDPDRSHGEGGFRPTVLMERISVKLELHDEPANYNWVEQNVQGNKKAKRTALDILHYEGYLQREDGPRNAHLYTVLKPYREAEEPIETTAPTTAPNCPGISVVFGTSTSPTNPPPFRGVVERGQSQAAEGAVSKNGTIDAWLLETQPDPDDEPF